MGEMEKKRGTRWLQEIHALYKQTRAVELRESECSNSNLTFLDWKTVDAPVPSLFRWEKALS